MLKLFSKLRLKYQIGLLFIVSAVTIITVQLSSTILLERITKDRTESYVSAMMSRINQEMASELDSTDNLARYVGYNGQVQSFLVDNDTQNLLTSTQNVTQYLTSMTAANSNIREILLLDKSKNCRAGKMSLSPAARAELLTFVPSSAENESVKTKQTPFFTKILKDQTNGRAFYAYILPLYAVINNEDILFKRIGTCVVVVDVRNLYELVQRTGLYPNALLAINGGETIASGELPGGIVIPEANVEKVKIDYYKGWVLASLKLQRTNWTMCSVVPIADTQGDLPSFQSISLLFTLVVLLLLGAMCFAIIRSITGPLTRIAVFTNRVVGRQDERLVLGQEDKNEIGQLSHNINDMLDRLSVLNQSVIDKQKELFNAELALQRAQLKALQSQINPHFLYNTLDCIKNIALVRNVNEIVTIVSSMSQMFRYAILMEKMVPVRMELQCIGWYMDIMAVRHRNRFVLQLEVDPALLEMSMLRMVLQPLVENAVHHGLEPRRGAGKLWVRGRVHDGLMEFTVEDDGMGITQEEMPRILEQMMSGKAEESIPQMKSSLGIGLNNIQERIRYAFGRSYGLSLEAREPQGLVVRLKLPAIAFENKELE
jgi:two-component system, sensor histidine kinase YesM